MEHTKQKKSSIDKAKNQKSHIDEAKEQLGWNIKRVISKNMISKSEVISLKQQAKRLKDYDEKFKPLFNKITNIV